MNARSLRRGEFREKNGVWYAKNLSGTFVEQPNRDVAERFAHSRTHYFSGGCMRFHYPPSPDLVEVELGPAWKNETGVPVKRLPCKQVTKAPAGFLNEEEFVRRLLSAQALVLADRERRTTSEITLVIEYYRSARVDRLGDRNRITNNLGLPECEGSRIITAMYPDRTGTFLANIITQYATRYLFVDEHGQLRLVTEATTLALGGYSALDPIIPEDYEIWA